MRSTEERRKIVWSGTARDGAPGKPRRRTLKLPATVTAMILAAAAVRWVLGRKGLMPARVRVPAR